MPSQSAHAAREINPPPKDSYRVYHADLIAQLEGDPGKLFLLHAIAFFDWGDTPRDTGDAPDIDHNFWERQWHMREKARRVIQGAEPWPRWAIRWKAFQELRYHHGRRKRPAWLDAPDDDPGGGPSHLAARLLARPTQRLNRLKRKLGKVRG